MCEENEAGHYDPLQPTCNTHPARGDTRPAVLMMPLQCSAFVVL